MRSWEKVAAIKDIPPLRSLGEAESAAFIQDLASVAVIENGQLPEGLITAARSPKLLLNALLANSVCTNLFRSPIFFLNSNDVDVLSDVKREGTLEVVYQRAKQCKLSFACQNFFY